MKLTRTEIASRIKHLIDEYIDEDGSIIGAFELAGRVKYLAELVTENDKDISYFISEGYNKEKSEIEKFIEEYESRMSYSERLRAISQFLIDNGFDESFHEYEFQYTKGDVSVYIDYFLATVRVVSKESDSQLPVDLSSLKEELKKHGAI